MFGLETSEIALLFRVMSWVILLAVFWVSMKRGLTHYVHWLTGAGLAFVSALVISGAGRVSLLRGDLRSAVLEHGDEVNVILSLIGTFMVLAVLMTMYRDRGEST